jgi:hypothetical protein
VALQGGFSMEQAESVLVLQDLWPVDAVQRLVNKSVVREVEPGRFEIAPSMASYARERAAP